MDNHIEIKAEPLWYGESAPTTESQRLLFLPQAVKTEDGGNAMEQSSYSAAINLAHTLLKKEGEEECEIMNRLLDPGFGFVDVGRAPPSELGQMPELDPLELSADVARSVGERLAILGNMKRAMETAPRKPSGDRGTLTLSVGAALRDYKPPPKGTDKRRSPTPDGREFTCVACGKIHRSRLALKQHALSVHTSDAAIHTSDAAIHTKSDTGSVNCTTTLTASAYNREKPYVCGVCQARFSKSSGLNDHGATHTKAKPFSCDVCDRKFSRMSNVIKHKKIHTGRKLYACDICDASFYEKSDVATHRRSHTGERPYSCEVCDAKFSQSSALYKHKISHSGVKPHSCEFCQARFSRRENLTAHKRRHATEKTTFSCQVCNERFFTREDLMVHKILQKQKNLCD